MWPRYRWSVRRGETDARESESEIAPVRDVAESLGIQLGDVTRSGSQANVIGIQSEAVVYDLCCVRAATIPKTTATER